MSIYDVIQPLIHSFPSFEISRTNLWTDGRTEGKTDIVKYRDAETHQKKKDVKGKKEKGAWANYSEPKPYAKVVAN